MDDDELIRRSVDGFGRMLTVVGHDGVGPGAVIDRRDALGARLPDLTANPWFDAVVVPVGATPPSDDPSLPYCIWSLTGPVDGRVPDPAVAMPCMGLTLDGPLPFDVPDVDVTTPSLAELGAMNDRAYGSDPVFAPLAARLTDGRVATHGLLDDGRFVCVALTLALGDDLAIHYVATEADHRRRGLATALLAAVIAGGRDRGMRSTTLQASPDGLPVYRRMGFRQVGLLQGWVRPQLPG